MVQTSLQLQLQERIWPGCYLLPRWSLVFARTYLVFFSEQEVGMTV